MGSNSELLGSELFVLKLLAFKDLLLLVDDVDSVAVNAALLLCTTIPSKRLMDKLRNCCSRVAENLSAVSVLGIVRTLSGLWSAKNNQLTFFLFTLLAAARFLLSL